MTNSFGVPFVFCFFLATIHLFLSQKFGCCVVIIVILHNAAGPAYVGKKHKKTHKKNCQPETIFLLQLSFCAFRQAHSSVSGSVLLGISGYYQRGRTG